MGFGEHSSAITIKNVVSSPLQSWKHQAKILKQVKTERRDTFLFILIPSFWGSELKSPNHNSVVWSSTEISLDPKLWDHELKLIPGKPIREICFTQQQSLLLRCHDVYGGFLDHLKTLPIDSDQPSILHFTYDWRESISHTAKKFNDFIARASHQWKKKHIIFICHGWGGVVLNTWINQYNQSDRNQVVSSSNPYEAVFVGVPETQVHGLIALSQQYTIHQEGLSHTLLSQTKSLIQRGVTIPSFIEAMPRLSRDTKGLQSSLPKALQRPSLPLFVHRFHGSKVPTTTVTCQESVNQCKFEEALGDGLVLSPDHHSSRKLELDHAQLFSDPSFLGFVEIEIISQYLNLSIKHLAALIGSRSLMDEFIENPYLLEVPLASAFYKNQQTKIRQIQEFNAAHINEAQTVSDESYQAIIKSTKINSKLKNQIKTFLALPSRNFHAKAFAIANTLIKINLNQHNFAQARVLCDNVLRVIDNVKISDSFKGKATNNCGLVLLARGLPDLAKASFMAGKNFGSQRAANNYRRYFTRQ